MPCHSVYEADRVPVGAILGNRASERQSLPAKQLPLSRESRSVNEFLEKSETTVSKNLPFERSTSQRRSSEEKFTEATSEGRRDRHFKDKQEKRDRE